jgi:hypothetical protein
VDTHAARNSRGAAGGMGPVRLGPAPGAAPGAEGSAGPVGTVGVVEQAARKAASAAAAPAARVRRFFGLKAKTRSSIH